VKILSKILFISLFPILLASCVTSKKVNLLQEPNDKTIPSYADTLNFEDYKIRIGDRLYINVYSIDEKTSKLFNSGGQNSYLMRQQVGAYSSSDLYTYLVLEDGTIDFPMVGNLKVRNLTTHEVKVLLEKELSTFLKNYQDYALVSVDVNIVQRGYSIISERGTGYFQIQKEKLTIFEALAQAGDIGDWSDRSKVRIVREIEGQTKVITFDVRSKDIINSEYYYIEPNDVIYIQKLKGQALGISNAATTVSIVATTLSFGGFIYAIVQRVINSVQKY
jgi:polysaccharide export outer membrane protein